MQPTTVVVRAPIRSARRPPNGDSTMLGRENIVSTIPDTRLEPRMIGSASNVPYIARLENAIVAFAAVNARTRNSHSGSAGSRRERSYRTNSHAPTPIAARAASRGRSGAESSVDSHHAVASSKMPSPNAPPRSKRDVGRARSSTGTPRRTKRSAASASGTLITKMARQSIVASRPPTSGPTDAPMPVAPATMPNCAPRPPAGSASRSTPSPFGTTAAAEIACCRRKNARTGRLGASAAPSEATVK